MDLLTVIAHETGHLLGYDHDEDGLMAEALGPGVRELPRAEPDREVARVIGDRQARDPLLVAMPGDPDWTELSAGRRRGRMRPRHAPGG